MNNRKLEAWLESDRKELLNTLKAEVRQHIAELTAKYSDVYGYALMPGPGPEYETTNIAAAWCRRSEMKDAPSHHRYHVDEWPHMDYEPLTCTSKCIEKLNQQFAALHSKPEDDLIFDEFEQAHERAFHETILRAMRELRKEGTLKFSEQDAYLAIWLSDSSADIIEESIEALNPPSLIREYHELMGTDTTAAPLDATIKIGIGTLVVVWTATVVAVAVTQSSPISWKIAFAGLGIFTALAIASFVLVRRFKARGGWNGLPKDEHGLTELHYAAQNSDPSRLKELLRKGADLNVGGIDGWPPLLSATVVNNAEAVTLLLDAGADVNATGDRGNSSLHHASPTVAPILLARGARVDLADKSGRTPLHTAAYWGRLEVIRLLLAAGASPSATDTEGKTPLQTAMEQNQTAAVVLLEAAETTTIQKKPPIDT